MVSFKEFPVIASFLAGIATFVSPCVLPLIPAYITFITGASLEELKSRKGSLAGTFLSALFFILGFSTIFVLLGASASYLGGVIGAKKDIIRWVGGIIIIVFGFHVSGLVPIKLLYHQKQFDMHSLKSKSLGYISSFLVGLAFAIGWTPCVGPILSSILILASTQDTVYKGTLLLIVYSFGLGVPFLITALFIDRALRLFTKIKGYFRVIEIASGVILIAIGVLIITDSFKWLIAILNKLL